MIDLLLALTLLGVAATALLVRELRSAAMLFIAFGLLMALLWARLGAPDVALAEAAIGAGIAGALLIDAAGALAGAPRTPPAGRGLRLLVLLPALGLAALLTRAALAMDPAPVDLAAQLVQALPQAQIQHPVTAVLLGFRAWDTLLEIAVLLITVITALGLPAPPRPALARDPLVAALAGLTLPLTVLMAVYLLWIGALRPGGAFQAAAVLAGGWLLARFAGLAGLPQPRAALLRALLGLGLGCFVLLAAATALLGGAVLAWPAGWTGACLLLLESTLTLSIAAALVILFGLEGGR